VLQPVMQEKAGAPGEVLLRLVVQLGVAAAQDALQVHQVLRLPYHLHDQNQSRMKMMMFSAVSTAMLS